MIVSFFEAQHEIGFALLNCQADGFIMLGFILILLALCIS
jgi:hypothetical protein